MSNGYWNSVPVGTWTVTDTTDVLEAIRDLETSWTFDERKARLHLFGPTRKALIVDLKEIKKSMDVADYLDFLSRIKDILGVDF